MAEKKIEKKKIYYTRTYRHLLANKKGSVLYLLLLVLPSLILMLLFYGRLTEFVSLVTGKVLLYLEPSLEYGYAWHTFIPGLSEVQVLTLQEAYPNTGFILLNIGAVLMLLMVCLSGKRKVQPVSIYLAIMMFVHMISSLFFLFAGEQFPYTAAEYSELYMKQQVGIWICFLVIMGLVTGLLGAGNYGHRIAVFAGVMLYSFAFGLIRYILFLYIIYKFSLLYMAVFFFALGPFFDFLYLVAIYGIYIDKMTNLYTVGKRKEEWVWS